jgi:hypothetical protein
MKAIIATCIGRRIAAASILKSDEHGYSGVFRDVNDVLRIAFDDGSTLHIWDAGQDCCEARYMSTDDDLSSLIGGHLVDVDVRDGDVGTYGDDSHETAFVKVITDQATITLVTHNEHNGYYGGFGLAAQVLP